MKNILRDKAVVLRKKGKSYSEIQKVLTVPKSTLSYWFKEIYLSDEIQKKLIEKSKSAGAQALILRNKQQTVLADKRAKAIREEALRQVGRLDLNSLFFVGVALYWGEGYKRGAYEKAWKCVDFTNSDPKMVSAMMLFFRKCCFVPEEKFRIHLMLHDREKENEARKFWSNLTQVSLNQFATTSFVVSSASQRKVKRRLAYGTIHVRIHDIQLFFRLIGWIEGMQKGLPK